MYKHFTELTIRQKAKDIAIEIYTLTNTEALQKDRGLKDQIRRSAISISSNIAEGNGRGGKQQMIYFLKIARGSCSELSSQIIIAQEIGHIQESKQLLHNIETLGKMISSLINTLKD